jgi:hypothetical protein
MTRESVLYFRFVLIFRRRLPRFSHRYQNLDHADAARVCYPTRYRRSGMPKCLARPSPHIVDSLQQALRYLLEMQYGRYCIMSDYSKLLPVVILSQGHRRHPMTNNIYMFLSFSGREF